MSSASEALAAGKPVVIVGAGLAGAMLARLLSQKGINVELFEKRPDARVEEAAEAQRLQCVSLSLAACCGRRGGVHVAVHTGRGGAVTAASITNRMSDRDR